MIHLSADVLSHVSGGHCLSVFTQCYTSLAVILAQKPVNVIEATHIYQALGHCVGEWVYTVFHPEPAYESLPINHNQT